MGTGCCGVMVAVGSGCSGHGMATGMWLPWRWLLWGLRLPWGQVAVGSDCHGDSVAIETGCHGHRLPRGLGCHGDVVARAMVAMATVHSPSHTLSPLFPTVTSGVTPLIWGSLPCLGESWGVPGVPWGGRGHSRAPPCPAGLKPRVLPGDSRSLIPPDHPPSSPRRGLNPEGHRGPSAGGDTGGLIPVTPSPFPAVLAPPNRCPPPQFDPPPKYTRGRGGGSGSWGAKGTGGLKFWGAPHTPPNPPRATLRKVKAQGVSEIWVSEEGSCNPPPLPR